MIAEWAQEDVEKLDYLLNNNNIAKKVCTS